MVDTILRPAMPLSTPTAQAFVPAPLPPDEAERLCALERYDVMGTPCEAVFDSLAALAAYSFRVPISLVGLIGEHEQFFKAAHGTEMRSAPRESSFCSFSILQEEPLVVLDATKDPTFRLNPHVQGGLNIRFYAGASIVSAEGFRLGTLCIYDTVRHTQFGKAETEALKHFASLASDALEMRLLIRRVALAEQQAQEAANTAAQILDATTDSVFLLDEDWNFTFLNARAQRDLRSDQPLLGKNFWDSFPYLFGSQIEMKYRKAMRERIPIAFDDYSARLQAFLEISATPSGTGLAVFFRDVTPQHTKDMALGKAEERYRLATQTNVEGIWDIDWQTGDAFFSARWQEIMGLPAFNFTGNIAHFTDRIHPHDVAQMQLNWRILDVQESSEFQHEYRVRHEDGSWHWILNHGTTVRDKGGKTLRRLGASRDITDKKTLDPLTGLRNRASLIDAIQERIGRRDEPGHEPGQEPGQADGMENGESESGGVARGGSTFALVAVSLDKFHRINDSFGHTRGDEVLIQSARRIEESLSEHPSSVAARIRGAEFAVMIDRVAGVEDVVAYAKVLQGILLTTIGDSPDEIRMSAIAGIAVADEGYTAAGRLLEDANLALNQAREEGVARCAVFGPGMRERTKRRLQLESDLKEALQREEFHLHYQPKVLLSTGEIVGFEALIRWKHPVRGWISPAEFIPHAEESGLILGIGEWTLRAGVQQLMRWRRDGLTGEAVTVAINLSSKQFENPGLVEDIRRCLKEEGAPESCLTLELTESVLIGNLGQVAESLKELSAAGIQIDMDDFGTGYSSLSYLQGLPFHALKIDQSFTRKLADSQESLAIPRSIIQLGQWLNMGVIAEGIETKEQEDRLIRLGCLYGQGYFYSKPLAPSGIEEMLRRSVCSGGEIRC
jgi:diguanylate cyclase (GGDEF)-like protein/PAS domain S-box-containing protein